MAAKRSLGAQRTVLFLGAGASRDCGIPTAEAFASPIRKHLSDLPTADAQKLISELDRVVGALPSSRHDLESIYQLIDDSLDAYFLQSTLLDQRNLLPASRALERLHYEIKKCIQRCCVLDDDAQAKHLDGLASFARDCGGLVIASANYDNAMEIMARRNGLSLCDPVIHTLKDETRADIVLLKLHGSVTWFIDRDGRPTEFEAFTSSAVRTIGAVRTATLDTPMIYPSRRKLPIQFPFLENAARFQEVLHHATRIISVGYRFADEHVRTWIIDCLRRRPSLELTVVDLRCLEPIRQLSNACLTDSTMDRVYAVDGRGFRELLEQGGLESALQKSVSARELLMKSSDLSSLNTASHASAIADLGLVTNSCRSILVEPTRLSPETGVSGLSASADGRCLLMISGRPTRDLQELDLASRSRRTLLSDIGAGRGIAAAKTSRRVYFLDNQLLRVPVLPTSGLGRLRCFDLDSGKLWNVTRPNYLQILQTLRIVRRSGWRSQLRQDLHNVLSWPTDLLLDSTERHAVVTQARELSLVDIETGEVETAQRPELCFNLHAIAGVDRDTIVGVEEGVAQTHSWGRIVEFKHSSGGWRHRIVLEGVGRLYGIAFDTKRRNVVVAQSLAWPHGKLLFLHYPSYRLSHVVPGLGFPQRIATHPNWDFLVFSDEFGLATLPLIHT